MDVDKLISQLKSTCKLDAGTTVDDDEVIEIYLETDTTLYQVKVAVLNLLEPNGYQLREVNWDTMVAVFEPAE